MPAAVIGNRSSRPERRRERTLTPYSDFRASASDREVKTAYRRLISQHHPDKLGDMPEELKRRAEERAREINTAYEKIREERRHQVMPRPAMKQPAVIAPSILSADFARLGEEVDNVLAAGADWVHFDVMDNHYVPNLTIGPLVCEALRKHGVKAPIDVHLMVKPVDRLVPDFAKAGASLISFHPEASEHIDRTLQLIRDSGCKTGLVFNPARRCRISTTCSTSWI